MFPATHQSPDKRLIQSALGNKNTSHLAVPTTSHKR